MNIWRELNPVEEKQFRQWTRDNWSVGDDINPVWHPIVRDEGLKITEESLTDEP